ncbi:MAG: hypothetical protein ACYSU7_11530 [Planctomycetota bacterium]
MPNWRVYFWIGLALFLLGGALLALDVPGASTFGTTMGVAGLGLMVWSWIGRRAGGGRF